MTTYSEAEIAAAMTVKLDDVLPEKTVFEEGIRRAPDRGFRLTQEQTETALKNALRYVPKKFHEEVIPEFLEELKTRGRIYAYRWRPNERIHGKPIDEYKGNCTAAKAMQVMIDNNLSFEITIGNPGEGQVYNPGDEYVISLQPMNRDLIPVNFNIPIFRSNTITLEINEVV